MDICYICLDKLSEYWPRGRKKTAKQIEDAKTCGKKKCKQEHRRRLREGLVDLVDTKKSPVCMNQQQAIDQFLFGKMHNFDTREPISDLMLRTYQVLQTTESNNQAAQVLGIKIHALLSRRNTLEIKGWELSNVGVG